MRTIAAALFLLLVASSYVWHRADVAATARAEWIRNNPIAVTDDAQASIVLFPSGLLNRSVKVVAFDLGAEDRTTEDEYADYILHTDAGTEFYQRGFRQVIVSGSSIPRAIVIAAPQLAGQTEESGQLSAWLAK